MVIRSADSGFKACLSHFLARCPCASDFTSPCLSSSNSYGHWEDQRSSCTQSAKNTASRLVSSGGISCNYGLLTDGEAEAPQGTRVTQGSSSLRHPELSSNSALQQGKHLSPVRSHPIQEAGRICTSVLYMGKLMQREGSQGTQMHTG